MPELLSSAVTDGRPTGSRLSRGASDVVTLLVIILAIPFAIIAIGAPIALVLQILLRIGRLF